MEGKLLFLFIQTIAVTIAEKSWKRICYKLQNLEFYQSKKLDY